MIRMTALICLILSIGSCGFACFTSSSDIFTQSFIQGFEEGAQLNSDDIGILTDWASALGEITFILSLILFVAQFLFKKEKP